MSRIWFLVSVNRNTGRTPTVVPPLGSVAISGTGMNGHELGSVTSRANAELIQITPKTSAPIAAIRSFIPFLEVSAPLPVRCFQVLRPSYFKTDRLRRRDQYVYAAEGRFDRPR